MSDYSDLKRLAELAIDEGAVSGQRWPQEDDWFEPDLISAEMDYVKAASPVAVLALISDNESLRADSKRYRYARDNLIYLSDWTDDEIEAAISSPENPY